MNPNVSAKTTATGGTSIGGGVLIVWLLGQFGVEIPGEVAAAIAGLLALIIAYFVPAKSGKYVVTEPIGDTDPSDAVEDPYDTHDEPTEVTDEDAVDHVEYEVVD